MELEEWAKGVHLIFGYMANPPRYLWAQVLSLCLLPSLIIFRGCIASYFVRMIWEHRSGNPPWSRAVGPKHFYALSRGFWGSKEDLYHSVSCTLDSCCQSKVELTIPWELFLLIALFDECLTLSEWCLKILHWNNPKIVLFDGNAISNALSYCFTLTTRQWPWHEKTL